MTLTEAQQLLLDAGYAPLVSRGRSDPTGRYWGNSQINCIAEVHEWSDDVRISYRPSTYKNLFILFYDDSSRRVRGEQWAFAKAGEA